MQLQQAPQNQLAGSNIIVSSVGVGGSGGLVSVMPATIVDPHQQSMGQQHQMQQQPPPQSTTSQQQSGSQQSSNTRHYSSMKSNTGNNCFPIPILKVWNCVILIIYFFQVAYPSHQ